MKVRDETDDYVLHPFQRVNRAPAPSALTHLHPPAKLCNSTQRGAIALIIGEFDYVGLGGNKLCKIIQRDFY